jgi:uncharacterized membrane protein
MRNGIDTARDAVRTQLWPLPTVGVALAVILGIALPRLDGRVDAHLPSWSSQYLFGGDSDAARTVLDAVAGSLITVTALTFSLTVVTLQLASGQFSPRLLRTFSRDLFVQATLAQFLATFTYALTVLRSVRTESSGQALFVPRLSYCLASLTSIGSSRMSMPSQMARRGAVTTTYASPSCLMVAPAAGTWTWVSSSVQPASSSPST